MQSGRSLAIGALLALSVMASSLAAQEDAPPAAGRGRGGGRGGRGGGGRGGTREFLGLGPAPDEAAAKKGEPLYKQNCATCHGENARGSQGPNLVRSVAGSPRRKGGGDRPGDQERPSAGRHAGLPEPLPGRSLQHLAVPAPAGGTRRQPRHLRRDLWRAAKPGERRCQEGRGVLQWRRRLHQLPFRHRRPGEDRREISAGIRHAIPLLMAGHARPGQGQSHPGFRRIDRRDGSQS